MEPTFHAACMRGGGGMLAQGWGKGGGRAPLFSVSQQAEGRDAGMLFLWCFDEVACVEKELWVKVGIARGNMLPNGRWLLLPQRTPHS